MVEEKFYVKQVINIDISLKMVNSFTFLKYKAHFISLYRLTLKSNIDNLYKSLIQGMIKRIKEKRVTKEIKDIGWSNYE